MRDWWRSNFSCWWIELLGLSNQFFFHSHLKTSDKTTIRAMASSLFINFTMALLLTRKTFLKESFLENLWRKFPNENFYDFWKCISSEKDFTAHARNGAKVVATRWRSTNDTNQHSPLVLSHLESIRNLNEPKEKVFIEIDSTRNIYWASDGTHRFHCFNQNRWEKWKSSWTSFTFDSSFFYRWNKLIKKSFLFSFSLFPFLLSFLDNLRRIKFSSFFSHLSYKNILSEHEKRKKIIVFRFNCSLLTMNFD